MTSKLIYAELGNQYVSPSSPVIIIDDAIRGVFDMSPLVLVDVKSGHLCDKPKRIRTFRSGPEFQQLPSSINERFDNDRVQRVVEKYFQCDALARLAGRGAFVPGRQQGRLRLESGWIITIEPEVAQLLRGRPRGRISVGMV